jgi:pimeloyl-ACP methyl ester carboxylesterase
MSDYGVVFIPGGGMSSWVWKDLDPEMRQRAVLIEGRLANNDRDARLNATLADCVDHIVEQMRRSGHSSHVIVGHSGGGMLLPLVAKRMPGEVKGLVFVSGNIPRNGENALQGLPFPIRLLNRIVVKKQASVDSTPARAQERAIRSMFCNTASADVVDYILRQKLLSEPLCVINEKVDWTGVPDIPMTFIRLLKDKTASLQVQDRMATHLAIRDKVDIESDHMVMLSHPVEFNEALRRIIEKQMSASHANVAGAMV